MSKKLVIIDTGCANIASVKYAVQRLGIGVDVSRDAQEIKRAQRVILPGVGSAPAAMQSINQRGLRSCIQGLKQPVLGVCLGMQLMVQSSEESELGDSTETQCLKLLSGKVSKMKVENLRLPHMGWNKVYQKKNNPLFENIDEGAYFYFVHGYAITKYEHTIASSTYQDGFSAAIGKDNFFGVQFHPERSSDAGAQLLKNFSRI